MAARSTGIFPREGFSLDAELEILEDPGAAAAVTLTNAKTIRVIVLGAAGIDDAGTNEVTVTVGGQDLVFKARDIDANGVGIAHVRGALCDLNTTVKYTLGGTATVTGVFYELVDGPAK